jgi:dipeptidyl aminopeptidase/acylaminoacyl peptidase
MTPSPPSRAPVSGPRRGARPQRRGPGRGRPATLVAALALTLAAGAPGAAPAAAQQPAEPPLLERLLAAPFPAAAVAAPVPGLFAWVEDSAGVRNIRVREPGGAVRQLTPYRRDDGQAPSQLAWLPDGRGLVYVRGQAPNAWGEHENPASDPAGAERALWYVRLDGAQPRRLAEGHSPAVSPRGDRVAFQRGAELWVAALAGDPAPRPLLRVRAGATGAAWAPDGGRIAFVSHRPGHSFVGVFDEGRGTVTWLAPAVDRDGAPRWSADGRRVAFVRSHRGAGWALVVADPETGTGDEVWRAPAEWHLRGVDGLTLAWVADRLVVGAEVDDWQTLVAVPAGGGTARRLTPAGCEVEAAALSPRGAHLVASTNCEDRERRQLHLLDPAGGAPRRLTAGAIDWGMAVDDAGLVVFQRGDARQPPRPHALALRGEPRQPAALRPAALPPDAARAALVEPEIVRFAAADGVEITGQLFRCAAARGPCAAARRPAVVFIHGGPARQMFPGWHNRGYYWKAYALNQYLASRGWVVLSVNYRGGTGQGRPFRLAPDRGRGGAAEYQDIAAAGRWLAARGDVDPARIGVWGGSWGGYLAMLALGRDPELFSAGVDLHGVHDFNLRAPRPGEPLPAAPRDEAWRRQHEASPVAWLERVRGPVLLVHGDDDRNVAFAQTADLVRQLRALEKPFELLVLPDEVHAFMLHRNWERVLGAAAEFLERHLR